MDISSAVHPNCISHRHRRKGLNFEPTINADSFSFITTNKQCRCSITLIYHNNIYIIQARYFNLLLPRGSFCSALLYHQATKKVRSRLNTRPKNWKGFVELFLSDLWLLFLNFETITLTLTLSNLQNLAHWDKLIGRFYYIFHGFSHKNLRYPCISITQIHFW